MPFSPLICSYSLPLVLFLCFALSSQTLSTRITFIHLFTFPVMPCGYQQRQTEARVNTFPSLSNHTRRIDISYKIHYVPVNKYWFSQRRAFIYITALKLIIFLYLGMSVVHTSGSGVPDRICVCPCALLGRRKDRSEERWPMWRRRRLFIFSKECLQCLSETRSLNGVMDPVDSCPHRFLCVRPLCWDRRSGDAECDEQLAVPSSISGAIRGK